MESRRDFVRGTVAAFAALFVAGTIAPADLSALPIQFTSGRSRGRALTYPIPPADGAVIDRDNEIILVRWQAQLYAFALSCPHQRSMLKWRDKEQRFQCTKHKSKYQPDGAYVSGRATRGMDRHPLRIAGDSVEVDTSIKIEQDQDPTAWDAAVADLA
ncbi:MAG: ubiquinol-cytochrome c reductase iron-sulfur subunit [Longimicrobiales bacterium]